MEEKLSDLIRQIIKKSREDVFHGEITVCFKIQDGKIILATITETKKQVKIT